MFRRKICQLKVNVCIMVWGEIWVMKDVSYLIVASSFFMLICCYSSHVGYLTVVGFTFEFSILGLHGSCQSFVHVGLPYNWLWGSVVCKCRLWYG